MLLKISRVASFLTVVPYSQKKVRIINKYNTEFYVQIRLTNICSKHSYSSSISHHAHDY